MPKHRVTLPATFQLDKSTDVADIEALLVDGTHPDDIRHAGTNQALLPYLCNLLNISTDTGLPQSRARAVLQLIPLLLRQGAAVNAPERNGETPLSYACRSYPFYGDEAVAVIDHLLQAGATLQACRDNPLHHCIGLLQMKGEIFNHVCYDGAPPEELARLKSITAVLTAAGADVNGLDRRGLYTPAMLAAHLGANAMLVMLMELGADASIANSQGTTALMYAAGDVDGLSHSTAGISCSWNRNGDPVAVARTLLAAGADPAAKNQRGRTALSVAHRSGSHDVAFEIAKALASRGLLTAADAKLFKGTESEARVAELPLVKAAKKAAPTPKSSSGEQQAAGWRALLESLTAQRMQTIVAGLAEPQNGLDYKQLLYVDHFVQLGTVQISKTKSWLSKSGYIEIGFDSEGGLVITSNSVPGDRVVELRRIRLSLDDDTHGNVTAVRQAFTELCVEKWSIGS